MGTKFTVPLSNPSQPATIKLSMIKGSVTVTGSASQQQVVVESSGDSPGRQRGHGRETPTPPGMHRIDTGDNSEVVEDHNVVTIKPGFLGRDHVEIQVPANANLEDQVGFVRRNRGHRESAEISMWNARTARLTWSMSRDR